MGFNLNNVTQGQSQGPANIKILNPNTNLRLSKPKFNDSGKTFFRPLPPVDQETGELLPFIDPNEPNDGISRWLIGLGQVADSIGNRGFEKKVTYINQLQQHEEAKYMKPPYSVLYSTLSGIKHDVPGLGWLFEGGKGRGADISRPKSKYLFQAAIFRQFNGKQNYDFAHGQIGIFLGSYSIMESIKELMYPYGDDAELGELFEPMLDINTPDIMLMAMKDGEPLPRDSEGETWDYLDKAPRNANNDFKGYAVHLVHNPSHNFSVPTKSDIVSNYVPPEEVYHVYSAEEQMQMLSNAFTPNIMQLAFQNTEFEPLIPQYVLDQWDANTSQVSFSPPADSVGGAQGQQQAPPQANYTQQQAPPQANYTQQQAPPQVNYTQQAPPQEPEPQKAAEPTQAAPEPALAAPEPEQSIEPAREQSSASGSTSEKLAELKRKQQERLQQQSS